MAIVMATPSERTHRTGAPHLWGRRGLPVMLITCLVASILLVLAYPLYVR